MLSALCWVNRECVRPVPVRLKITEEEAKKIIDDHAHFVSPSSVDFVRHSVSSSDDCSNSESEACILDSMEMASTKEHIDIDGEIDTEESIIKKYNLKDYPESSMSLLSAEDENVSPTKADFERIFADMNTLSLLSPRDDPYLLKSSKSANQDTSGADDFDDYFDEEEDMDDLTIRPTDYLLVTARVPEDDDIAQLEFYVYEESEDNLYVHHDIMLPTFPLCLEWADYATGRDSSNLVAVGSFDPTIEIWDLDIIDPVYPYVMLGSSGDKGPHKEGSKKLSTKKKALVDPWFHTGSIMSISWNAITRFLFLHNFQVSCASFSPFDAPIIASTSFDKSVKIVDMRDPSSSLSIALQSDGEVVKWNPFDANLLAVADENGTVYLIDRRSTEPLSTVEAHSKPISSIDYHPLIPGLLLTSSFDKHLKIWDTLVASTLIFDRKLGAGNLLTGSFCKNSPFLVAYTGTDSQDPHVLNLSNRKSYRSDVQFESMQDLFETRLQSIRTASAT
ncbi:hypothetical protein DI09_45p30 [Mitosporidium daphniae]|uniref:Uncharacterized protein n=1 Tax=Mitosporidium daphniae TaxID=1485682 RepID=A0A098VTM5_9MICR|nr:uncharacterized protein DI09_45p30 [Mitosporidium daphniae]KGG51076.1 hypothetical protein DI09_45p30 [Mitosporidium daphniae]|eukprot:XP_013237521.1 uncharacterized protein DI09_45p30 [Mitosporidium daphniae]